ncbi:DinB family protein [Breznakiellaceae bacterium SP9]
MKDQFLIIAKYNQTANVAALDILDKLSNDEREKDRGSYYGSLSGLARHIVGGTLFFQSIFKGALGANQEAVKAIASAEGYTVPEGALDAVKWSALRAASVKADAAFVQLVSVLSEADLSTTVPVNFYKGNPAAVPLWFLFQNLTVHNTHHRGQLSQILDSLKISNDYSGIPGSSLVS